MKPPFTSNGFPFSARTCWGTYEDVLLADFLDLETLFEAAGVLPGPRWKPHIQNHRTLTLGHREAVPALLLCALTVQR